MAATPGPAAQVLAAHGMSAEVLRAQLRILGREASDAEDSLDADALASLGIDLDRVREATERHLGPGALDRRPGKRRAGHLPLTQQGKKILELSMREAVRLESGAIGSGHLLLALLRDGEQAEASTAATLLSQSGVEFRVLRDEVSALIPRRAA